MKITEAFLPHLQVCESHYYFYGQKDIIADAVERIADEGFFKSIGLATIPDAADRKRIGKTVRSHGLNVTYWLGYIFWNSDELLDPSSLDETVRKKTTSRVIELIDQAVECGTTHLGLVSGDNPGEPQCGQAIEQFYKSACEICQAAEKYSMKVMLEPLDRNAHKCFAFGYADDAVNLAKRLRENFSNVALCWDSSHSALNGEDIIESLVAMSPYLDQLHFANPVLDKTRKDFGDHHIAIGPPGELTIEKMAEVYKKAIEIGLFIKHKPSVTPEVRAIKNQDPWKNVGLVKKTLIDSWDLYEKKYANK